MKTEKMKKDNNHMPKRPPMKKGVLSRLFKMLFADYKSRLFIVAVCIIITSVAATSASVFMNVLIPMT